MTTQRDSVSQVTFGRKLGGGYFGKVFEGTQAPHGSVAVKVIKFGRMKQFLRITDWTTVHDHLLREAEALRKAESSHIVRVHGVGVSEDKKAMHIITERCDGSLATLCHRGPLSTRRARESTKEALHGLEALHARGMIHRDLKPANLLHVGGVTKLADFGLVTSDIVYGYASRAGYTEHLAPEVFVNSTTSPRTDVWAMGLTIFRLVNGEPWYHTEKERLRLLLPNGLTDPRAVQVAVKAGGFASKLRWMPHIHDAWRRFVRRAMHDDTDSRFSDGGEMLTNFSRSIAPLNELDWTCDYTDQLVRWTTLENKRRLVVEWRRGSQHSIVAWSEPVTPPGRTRMLLPFSTVSPLEAARQLTDFFEGKVRR